MQAGVIIFHLYAVAPVIFIITYAMAYFDNFEIIVTYFSNNCVQILLSVFISIFTNIEIFLRIKMDKVVTSYVEMATLRSKKEIDEGDSKLD